MATSLTLRVPRPEPLTNQEVDDNFSSLNDNKLEIDGSNSMTGKLTTVISSATRASILLSPGSSDPSTLVSGDFWNNSGNFKFFDGNDTYTITTTTGSQLLTNKTLSAPLISNGIFFEGAISDDYETYLTVENPTVDRVVTIPDTDGDVMIIDSGTVYNDVLEIDSSGNFTLDAVGDIVLDADNSDIILKDNAIEFGRLSNVGSELIIRTGATSTTALTLSSSGGDVTVAGDLTVNGNTIKSSSASAIEMNGADVTILGDLSVTGTLGSPSGTLVIDGDIQINGNDIKSSTGSTALTLSNTNVIAKGNLTVQGDLQVDGTTTTVNSTVVTIDDPIFTLGGNTPPVADDNKDRGIEFRWHNGSADKVGFFGFDDSTGYWTFIPDAANASEVFSGTKGTLDVAGITGTASAWTTARTLSLTGAVTGSASIDGSGNVAISTTLNTSSTTATFDRLVVGTASTGAVGTVRASGEITAYATSDARLKENVVEISNALDKVSSIRGVNFDWNEEHIQASGGEDGYFVRRHDVGVIAQEVEEVLPEVVAEREDGFKAVRYEKIVPLLIEAIKELKSELESVKNNCKCSQ